MAANLTASVILEGAQAISQAKAVGDAMTQMGAAGDAAAQKVAAAGPKMSAPMKEATVAAAQAKSMFGELQAAAARPVAGGGAAGVLPLLQALERARIFYEQLNVQAKETASLGGRQAAAFNEAANAAKGMTDALASTREMVSGMVAEGVKMDEVYAAVKEQIGLIETPLKVVGAEARQAFQAVEAGLEKTIASTAQFQKISQTVEVGLNKEIAAAQKAAAQKEQLRQKEAAAAEAAAQKEAAAAEKAAAAEAAAAEKAAAAAQREAAAAEKLAAAHEHGGRAAQAIMVAERGWHDILGQGFGGVGKMIRGVDDLALSLARGGAGMLAITASMGVLAVAMKAVSVPLDILKEGMKSASDEEKLSVSLKDVVGSGKLAEEELNTLKDFITGPLGAAFQMDDVEEGVRKLQLATGQVHISIEDLNMLGAAAEANYQKFSAVATTYTNVTNQIQMGQPLRSQMLRSLVEEGVLTDNIASKLLTMSKAHASVNDMMRVFREGLNNNKATAEGYAGTLDNLEKQLRQTFDVRIAAPFGAAINHVLEQIVPQITKLFTGHDTDIKNMADTLEYNLMFAFNYIKEMGLGRALQDGWDAMITYVRDTAIPALWDAFSKWWTEQWHEFEDEFDTLITRMAQKLMDLPGNLAKAFQEAVSFTPDQAVAEQINRAYGVGPGSIPGGGQAYTTSWNLAAKAAQDNAEAAKAQTEATKSGADATKAGTDATKAGTTVADALKNSNQALKTSVDVLIGALSGMSGWAGGMFTAPGATRAFAPPVPGATPGVRAMQYGPVVGEYGTAQTTGAWGQALGPKDIAVSIDLLQQYGLHLHDVVNVIDQTGKVLIEGATIADTSWRKAKNAAEEAYSAQLHAINVNYPLGQVPTGGIETRTGRELGYAALIRPGTGVETDAERIARETRQQIEDARKKRDADQQAKATGAPPPVEKPDKTKDLTEAKSLTDQLTDATKQYEEQLKLIGMEKKTHQISDAQAAKEELQQYQLEENALVQIRSRLEAAYEAAKQAHDPKLAEEYRQKLVQLDTKLLDIKGHMQEIAQTHTFGGQFHDELQKTIDQLQFTGKTAADDLTKALDSVGQGLTSIIDGSAKAGDAFKAMAKQIIDQLSQIAFKLLESQLLQMLQGMGWFGGAGGAGAAAGGGGGLLDLSGLAGGTIFGYQHGGMVYGPGGDDKVQAWLTAGEFVVSKAAVARMGVDFLHTLNQTHGPYGNIRGYAAGGLVGLSPQNVPPSMTPAASQGGNVTVATTINIGGTTGALPGQRGDATGAGMSKEQITQFQTVINAAIRQEISVQKRPGGLLNRNAV